MGVRILVAGGKGDISASFALKGSAGFCNAVRRTLLSDLYMWAPKEILIRSNMSCQTDEYLAHRIGMIPSGKLARETASASRPAGQVWCGAASLLAVRLSRCTTTSKLCYLITIKNWTLQYVSTDNVHLNMLAILPVQQWA